MLAGRGWESEILGEGEQVTKLSGMTDVNSERRVACIVKEVSTADQVSSAVEGEEGAAHCDWV